MYSFRFHLNITADTTTGIQVYHTFKICRYQFCGDFLVPVFSLITSHTTVQQVQTTVLSKFLFFALPSHRPKVFRSPGKYTGVKADCCCLKRNKKTNHELLNSGSAMNRKIVVHNKSADSKKPFWTKTIFLVII